MKKAHSVSPTGKAALSSGSAVKVAPSSPKAIPVNEEQFVIAANNSSSESNSEGIVIINDADKAEVKRLIAYLSDEINELQERMLNIDTSNWNLKEIFANIENQVKIIEERDPPHQPSPADLAFNIKCTYSGHLSNRQEKYTKVPSINIKSTNGAPAGAPSSSSSSPSSVDSVQSAVIFFIRSLLESVLMGSLTEKEIRVSISEICKDNGIRATGRGTITGLPIEVSTICGIMSAVGAIKSDHSNSSTLFPRPALSHFRRSRNVDNANVSESVVPGSSGGVEGNPNPNPGMPSGDDNPGGVTITTPGTAAAAAASDGGAMDVIAEEDAAENVSNEPSNAYPDAKGMTIEEYVKTEISILPEGPGRDFFSLLSQCSGYCLQHYIDESKKVYLKQLARDAAKLASKEKSSSDLAALKNIDDNDARDVGFIDIYPGDSSLIHMDTLVGVHREDSDMSINGNADNDTAEANNDGDNITARRGNNNVNDTSFQKEIADDILSFDENLIDKIDFPWIDSDDPLVVDDLSSTDKLMMFPFGQSAEPESSLLNHSLSLGPGEHDLLSSSNGHNWKDKESKKERDRKKSNQFGMDTAVEIDGYPAIMRKRASNQRSWRIKDTAREDSLLPSTDLLSEYAKLAFHESVLLELEEALLRRIAGQCNIVIPTPFHGNTYAYKSGPRGSNASSAQAVSWKTGTSYLLDSAHHNASDDSQLAYINYNDMEMSSGQGSPRAGKTIDGASCNLSQSSDPTKPLLNGTVYTAHSLAERARRNRKNRRSFYTHRVDSAIAAAAHVNVVDAKPLILRYDATILGDNGTILDGSLFASYNPTPPAPKGAPISATIVMPDLVVRTCEVPWSMVAVEFTTLDLDHDECGSNTSPRDLRISRESFGSSLDLHATGSNNNSNNKRSIAKSSHNSSFSFSEQENVGLGMTANKSLIGTGIGKVLQDVISPQFSEITPIELKVLSEGRELSSADDDSERDEELTDTAVALRHEKVLKNMRERWARILELKRELKELTGGSYGSANDSLAGINNFGFPSSGALGRKRKHSIDSSNANGRKRGRPPLLSKSKGNSDSHDNTTTGNNHHYHRNHHDSKSDKSLSASDDGSETSPTPTAESSSAVSPVRPSLRVAGSNSSKAASISSPRSHAADADVSPRASKRNAK